MTPGIALKLAREAVLALGKVTPPRDHAGEPVDPCDLWLQLSETLGDHGLYFRSGPDVTEVDLCHQGEKLFAMRWLAERNGVVFVGEPARSGMTPERKAELRWISTQWIGTGATVSATSAGLVFRELLDALDIAEGSR